MDEHPFIELDRDDSPVEAQLPGLTPPRAPKQARSRDKRDRLLAAALALFAEHGYDGTTIDTIANQAGVSVGVFYSYFRNKRQMLLTLAQQRMQEMRINLSGIDPLRMSVDELAANLLAQLQLARDYAGLRRARHELALTDEEVADYERQQRDWIRARLADKLAEGRAARRFRDDLDDSASALAIIALIAQLQEWVSDLSPEEDTRIAHAAALMIARMVAPTGALLSHPE